MILSPANVTMREGTLFSLEYNDIYFNAQQGVDESRYVFIQHNNLYHRFQQAHTTPFTLFETGFGTGLNFLLTTELFSRQAPANQWLHYIAVEKHPLHLSLLRRFHQNWPELSNVSKALLQHYPPLVRGFHNIKLPQFRTTLTLIWEEAVEALRQLDTRIDAWYLDGFAPAKNPHMWLPELFNSMARLSKSTTTFSTFTAASMVRKSLETAGFEVVKTPGFGRKRDMLTGLFTAWRTHSGQKPWYVRPTVDSDDAKKAIVIGGGISGVVTAYTLAQRGWQVRIIEAGADIVPGASGNPQAALFTKLSAQAGLSNRFQQAAYLYALRQMSGLPMTQCGLLYIKENENQSAITECWPDDLVQRVDAQEASDIAKISLSTQLATYYPRSGVINPAALCAQLINHPNIGVTVRCSAHFFQYDKNLWQVYDQNQQMINQAPYVIFCNAMQAVSAPGASFLPLRPIRGQISFFPENPVSHKLACVLSGDSYILPSFKGRHVVGATFYPKNNDLTLYAQDHVKNLESVHAISPALYQGFCQTPANHIQGRVGIRCQTPDYFPVAGPVPGLEFYQRAYGGLRTGKIKQKYPEAQYLPGLYLNCAHGSKGFVTSWLCAEMILSYLEGQSFPVDLDLMHAVHPARFIVRALKRKAL